MRLLTFIAFLALAILVLINSFPKPAVHSLDTVASAPTATPTPTPPLIDIYVPPRIATASSYTVIFTGDSMTEALGPNFDSLRKSLQKYYPEKVFGLFNYGFGSTNILSLEDRLIKSSDYQGHTLEPILDRYFDVIIIESMGTNPLSQYPLDQGLAIQTQTLDRTVALIAYTHPNSVIVFLATIAPSQTHFGLHAVELSPEKRNEWANERRFYIENHINYAKRHHIPLINVYEKSLSPTGVALLKYINSTDYIHPSKLGVDFISQSIADYLFQNQILYP